MRMFCKIVEAAAVLSVQPWLRAWPVLGEEQHEYCMDQPARSIRQGTGTDLGQRTEKFETETFVQETVVHSSLHLKTIYETIIHMDNKSYILAEQRYKLYQPQLQRQLNPNEPQLKLCLTQK